MNVTSLSSGTTRYTSAERRHAQRSVYTWRGLLGQVISISVSGPTTDLSYASYFITETLEPLPNMTEEYSQTSSAGYVIDSTDHTITASEPVSEPFATINAVIDHALRVAKLNSPSIKESQLNINDEDMTALTDWAASSPKFSDITSTVWAQSKDTLAGTVEACDSTETKILVHFTVDLCPQG